VACHGDGGDGGATALENWPLLVSEGGDGNVRSSNTSKTSHISLVL